ncbi:MAG: transcription-repair coupling factor [Nitrospirae bacterium]|nr:transcription-repair coupling factor [Nitrospirota bacterium]
MENLKVLPPVFGDAIDAVAGGAKKTYVTGLWGSSKALFLWELAATAGRPLLVVCPTSKEAEALYSDFSFFAATHTAGNAPSQALLNPLSSRERGWGEGVPLAHAYFPPFDILPYDVMEPDPAIVARRIKALGDIHAGRTDVVVTTVKALMGRLPLPGALVGPDAVFKVEWGDEFGLSKLVNRLEKAGYGRSSMVYEPGEYTVRGGIVDFYPPGADAPVRVEFFGDTVESIREFDPETQRSLRELEEVTAPPARESGPRQQRQPRPSSAGAGRGGGRLFQVVDEAGTADLTSYFQAPPVFVMDEPERVASLAGEFEEKVFAAFECVSAASTPVFGDDNVLDAGSVKRPEALYRGRADVLALSDGLTSVRMSSMPMPPGDGPGPVFAYQSRSIEGLRLRDAIPADWPEELPKTPVAVFCLNLRGLMDGQAVNVVSQTAGQAERLREIFAEHGLPAEAGPPAFSPGSPLRVSVGELSSGFLMDPPGLAFVTAGEIFGEKPRRAPSPRAKVEHFLTTLSELSSGDFVVHIDHGIGRYIGLKRLALMGVEADFLDVVYMGDDHLYVPVDELGKVQKYIGAEDAAVKLDRLGGVAWEKAKSKAKKAVEEMAQELLELYAKRAVASGYAYSQDDHLYREMEGSFEYEETPDQYKAIVDVKADMERPHPMDRLVCGDVGYGKTEVAVRAAFKAALDGKQAAVLVPTTLLASQHFETFSSRLAGFPVRVEALSRFTPKERVKEIIKGIGSGEVDIVIGTHRILSKDVVFRDLGLIVIDEEHRFGVAHKERLKQFRKEVDVLTLTATPIPRTLHMSITGIRDLSVIETPPPDRQPIKTIITRFDRGVIKDAVTRELERGGQVFFVHNRIETIFAVGDMLKGIVPDARICVAHGRMHEDALEKVMSGFISGEFNLLLTTSIIESGLDIPSANTIIINRADRFGLADLYQLRGRVGRSRRRAYAYLLVPGEDTLSATAQKRLRVLSELTELGAGFKLALHDLEIRGAGNILGHSQSGHISAVGFEMYTRLLEDAVKGLRGEAVEESADPALDLKVSAYIPDSYVSDTAHRLGIYKRLSGAASEAGLREFEAELADRFGPLPEPAKRLVEVMELKVLARALKVGGIHTTPTEIKITFMDKVDIPPDRLLGYLTSRRGAARYVPRYTLYLKKPSGGWEPVRSEIKNCLKGLA